jgi:hypothetical protein
MVSFRTSAPQMIAQERTGASIDGANGPAFHNPHICVLRPHRCSPTPEFTDIAACSHRDRKSDAMEAQGRTYELLRNSVPRWADLQKDMARWQFIISAPS